MAIKVYPILAYNFFHDNIGEYVCRACMKKSHSVKMKSYKDENGMVWIECPKCGAKENISVKEG